MAASGSSDHTGSAHSGILLIVLGLSVAAFTGGLMKSLTGELSPVLIGWFRFTGGFLIMVPFALARAGPRAFRPPRVGVQVMRGLFMTIGTLSFMTGVRHLDYADAIAILYAYPFMMTLMAPLILGERVSMIGWLGVFGGFSGVVLVVRPELQSININALFVLFTGLLVALQMLLNRKLGTLSDPMVISMWGALVSSLVLLPALPWFWQPMDLAQLGILALMALTSAISQTLIILALSRAPASDLAPFTYAEIVAAVLLGFFMFGTLPDVLSWSGIGLIILSGVVVAWAQAGRTVLRRQPKI